MKARALQKAHAELIRKQRELDDARRKVDLSVETRVPGIAWGCACESQTRVQPRACETDLTKSRLYRQVGPLSFVDERLGELPDRKGKAVSAFAITLPEVLVNLDCQFDERASLCSAG